MKNYLLQILSIVVNLYLAVKLIFYPEKTDLWFIQVLGGLFIMQAISNALKIQNIYLENKMKKLEERLRLSNERMKDILKQ